MPQESKDEFSILFTCIHKRLSDKVGLNRTISLENIRILLGTVYHIPKPMRMKVIDELIDRNIIAIEEHRLFRVLPFTSDLFDGF